MCRVPPRGRHPPPPRSNRSAALLQLSKTTKAVADAEQCIRLRPDWDRGYSRKAAVLEVLGRLEEVRPGRGGVTGWVRVSSGFAAQHTALRV